jgi:glucosamine 6-phosphate synthetase-like amidotransferase/phosphosugar isomerase protein
LIDYNNCLSARRKEKIIKILSAECEVRGTDATGVAYIADGKMSIFKRPLPAHKMHFKFKSNPKVIMGHTRMTTQGSERINRNNHPFYSNKLGFALAHNGMLHNDKQLRKANNLPKTKIETDSYIAVQLIDSKHTLDFNSLKYMAETVEGSFCFTVLSKENELYIVKGDNPMAVAKLNGYYIYASTISILMSALKRLRLKHFDIVELKDDTIVKFCENGKTQTEKFERKDDFGYFGKMKNSVFMNNKVDEEYLEDLTYYGNTVGIDEDAIMEMFNCGYSYMEIEDMIFDFECAYDEEVDYAEI